MPVFHYRGTDSSGSVVTGLVFGINLDIAARDLTARGVKIEALDLAPDTLDPLAAPKRQEGHAAPMQGAPEGGAGPTAEQASGQGPATHQRSYFETSVAGPVVGRVSLQEQKFFFDQLAAMLHAGVPYVQCLDTLGGQAQNAKFRGIIRELRGHVEAGRPISAGMQRYPEVFSPVTLSIIRVGEEAGGLDGALNTAAGYLGDEIELNNHKRRVTIYPKIVLFASIIIILAANLIIESINPGAMKLTSPLTTASTWYVLGPLIIGIFLFMRVGLANPRVRFWWDGILLRIPYVGKTVHMMATARFGRSVAAMYKAGVPITKVIQLGADSCGNEYLRAQIYPAAKVLESGRGLTETMRATGAVTPMVLDMIATGERTGEVDQMLGKMADYYADESKTRAIALGHVFGVFVMVCTALYIGYVVITFYTNFYGGLLKQAN